MRGVYAGSQITLAVDALGRLRVLRVNVSDLAGVHGDLAGLDADDHPQYWAAGVKNHGELLGLDDYDHDQYVRKDLSQAIEGAIFRRNVDTDLIQIHGGTAAAGTGADVRLYGANHALMGGDLYVSVPNAAKDNPVLVLAVDGNTDTPVTDWQGRRLTNVADPTANQDAVTRKYLADNPPVVNIVNVVGYSVGTWTPTLSFGWASVGITYSQRLGTYVKIGRLVTAWAHIILTSKGTSAGTARIEGLPFTAYFTGALETAVTVNYQVVTFTVEPAAYIDDGTTAVSLIQVTAAGAESVLTNANFANASALRISAIYRSQT